jgi:hypothetical protein
VSPPGVPRATAEELVAALSRRDGWRTLGNLKGFDANDFDFLPPAPLPDGTGQVAVPNHRSWSERWFGTATTRSRSERNTSVDHRVTRSAPG